MDFVKIDETLEVKLVVIDSNDSFINYLASGAINTIVEVQMDEGKFNGQIYYYDGDVNDDGDSLWEKLDNKVVENKIIAEHNKFEDLAATA